MDEVVFGESKKLKATGSCSETAPTCCPPTVDRVTLSFESPTQIAFESLTNLTQALFPEPAELITV